MKANGFAYLVDALAACVNGELAQRAESDEEPLFYTDGQIVEHILPPRPQTNDLKAIRRTVESRAKSEGLGPEEAEALLEELMYQVDNKPRSATKLSRIKTQMTPQEIVKEFLLANDLNRAHAEHLEDVALDAVAVMERLVKRGSVFCSTPPKRATATTAFERTDNAVRLLATSPRFPRHVRDTLAPAVLSYLESSHQSEAIDEFTNTLEVLLRAESASFQQAAGAENASPQQVASTESAYLKMRGSILGHLLAAALCGSCGVRALSRDAYARTCTETEHVSAMVARRSTLPTSDRCATLVEQLVDSAGNVIFGTAHPLSRNAVMSIGRMPQDDTTHVITVRYVADGVGSAVSRTHASVLFSDGRWVIRDESSCNGIALARATYDPASDEERFGEAVMIAAKPAETELRNGDVIFLAPARYSGGHLGPNPQGATYRFMLS